MNRTITRTSDLKDIQPSIWEVGYTNRKVIFLDDEVMLSAKITWETPNTNLINKIDFEVRNFKPDEVIYKICKIARCTNVHAKYRDYVMIHFTTKGDLSEVNSSFTAYHNSGNPDTDLGNQNIDLTPFSSFTFLFKIHENDCPGILNDCLISGTQPESKDGSIIVSI